jgi:D-arginine dehydrogenase
MSNNDTHFDIAVIGAGAAGLSVAYFLAPHARVVVLEREDQPAYHSSGRSAAMYIEGYENPVVQELTSTGREFFFNPPPGFAEFDLVTRAGGLTVAGPGEGDALNKYLNAWQASCPQLVEISAAECRDMVPILSTAWVSGGAFDPSWHNIDVHGLLTGYQRGVREHAGDIRSRWEVTELTWEAGQWNIKGGAGPLTADVVVNASGAWANHTASLAGLPPVPLTPMRRTAAIVPAPEHSEAWPLVHTTSEQLYFKPESPGLMVSPADETPSEAMDAYPLDLDIAIAMEAFHQVTDHPVEHVIRSWAGLRTFAPDRRPVVGFAPQTPGFFWLAGQGGFGIQTSPGLGRLAAEIILGRASANEHINVLRFAA